MRIRYSFLHAATGVVGETENHLMSSLWVRLYCAGHHQITAWTKRPGKHGRGRLQEAVSESPGWTDEIVDAGEVSMRAVGSTGSRAKGDL